MTKKAVIVPTKWDIFGAASGLRCTEDPENVCTWLREVSSCSCLTVLPGPAWVLLSKKYILFPGALYLRRWAQNVRGREENVPKEKGLQKI